MLKESISRILLVIIVMFILSMNLLSQNTLFNSKVNWQIGSYFVNTYSDVNVKAHSPFLYSSLSYKVNKYLEAGLYIGSGNLMHQILLPYDPVSGYYQWYSIDSTSHIKSNTSNGGSTRSKAINYGITCNVQLIQLLTKRAIRFEIFLQPQFGFLREKHFVYEDFQKNIWSKHFFEYGLGIGLKYNFTKQFGVFSDYNFGRYYNNQKRKIKLGISIVI